MSRLTATDEQRVDEVVLRAGTLPTSERSAFLDVTCGSSPAVHSAARHRLTTAASLRSSFLAPLGHLLESTLPATEPELLPAGTVIGPYRLDGLLGRGGMGEVYRAHEGDGDRSVAIKHIRSEAADPGRRQRFWREARALARLGHPAIVRILDFLEIEDSEWIVMELAGGKTLAELLRDGPLEVDLALAVGCQVASALAAAHARGVVHRDLKTENVMVSGTGAAKVLDFGLARFSREARYGNRGDAELSATGLIVGTPRVMSPEQARGRPVDARSDLFSLGVLLYEALTARSPFLAESLGPTLERVTTHHPPPVRRLNPGVSRSLSDLVGQLLEKDPARRGDGACAAARTLTDLAAASPRSLVAPAMAAAFEGAASGPAALRIWPPPDLPELPYPMQLPCAHPALLAGREGEIRELRDRLRMCLPILGLYGPSGVGKSSLLLGGLVPALRAEGRPVALIQHPVEPGIAGRLAGDLLVDVGQLRDDLLMADNGRGFLESLRQVERLATQPAILVIDQLEEMLKPDADASALGALLAATVGTTGAPAPCRWLLAYRQEFHGAVEDWLDQVLRDRHHGCLHSLPLPPLAAPPGGLSDEASLEHTTRTFLTAIEKPLALRDEHGRRRYPIRFAPGNALLLARAFAEARRDRPDAPLVPELQVVLAHLVDRAGFDGGTRWHRSRPAWARSSPGTRADSHTFQRVVTAESRPGVGSSRIVRVSNDPAGAITEALEDHLRRALKAVFPDDPDGDTEVRNRRARTLRALYQLAAKREQGLRVEDLARAIGEDGEDVLARLATSRTRLIVFWRLGGDLRCLLSHDRMADAIRRLIDDEIRRGERLLEAALCRSREEPAARVPPLRSRRVSARADALPRDREPRAWWAAWRRRRLELAVTLALAILALVGGRASTWAHQRVEHRALLEQVAHGEPGVALRALDRLATRPDADRARLLDQLRQREAPMDVLELGLSSLDDSSRSATVLRAVEIALPWVEASPQDPVLVANLVSALDFAPGRETRFARRARALRDQVLAPLRRLRPPTPVEPEDPDWIQVPVGRFSMSIGHAKGDQGQAPRHEVIVSAFRMQRHEVTNAEYRRLVPEHGGDDGVAAASASWYAAYTYAAWLGGRLPTEAEWEYAARAGCRFAYCARDGRETTIDAVAWTLRNSYDPFTGTLAPRPVMELEPNPWGFYDMLGNLWEWTADWYDEYPATVQRDPWGPAASPGGWRVDRGGCFKRPPGWSRAGKRSWNNPGFENLDRGLRVVLPAPQNPSLRP